MGLAAELRGPKRSSRTLPKLRLRWILTRAPKCSRARDGQGKAGVHGGFVVGGGFSLNQLTCEGDEAGLFAAGAREQRRAWEAWS